MRLKETAENSLVKRIWGFNLILNEKISGSEKKARRNRYRMGMFGLKALNAFGMPVGSRLVENSWVLNNLGKGKNVLDVGCCCSFLLYELIGRGYNTYATDFNDYDYKEKINFVKADLTKRMPFKKDFFDSIILISTLEHIGLGQYNDTLKKSGDIVALKNLKRILKPGGRILITIPISKEFFLIKEKKRKYDKKALSVITKGFTLEKEEYFMFKNVWKKVSKKKALSRNAKHNTDDAIACLILRK